MKIDDIPARDDVEFWASACIARADSNLWEAGWLRQAVAYVASQLATLMDLWVDEIGVMRQARVVLGVRG
jgi:hypothetical protein